MGFSQILVEPSLADNQGLPTKVSNCLGSPLALGAAQPRSVGTSLPAWKNLSSARRSRRSSAWGHSRSLSGPQAPQTAQGQAGKTSPGLSLPPAPVTSQAEEQRPWRGGKARSSPKTSHGFLHFTK